MNRRITCTLAVLLALCCICTLATPAFAHSYTDVGSLSQEYKDAINYLYDNDIMVGVQDTQFGPNTYITRAMAVSVLYRLSGDTGTYTDASKFTDVSSSSYYYNAVGWGVRKGIVAGTSDTTFSPSTQVKFQDLCSFLYRYVQMYGSGTQIDEVITDAADYSSVSSYAVTPLRWAYSYGLKTHGSGTYYIYPKSSVTRKDLALYLGRYRRNAVGISFGSDNFSFLNDSSYFAVSNNSGNYTISASDWNYLDAYASKCDPSIQSSLRDFYNSIGNWWTGCCYGMSLAVCLDLYGKIDFNGNFCNNASTIYGIPSPVNVNSSKHKRTTDKKNSGLTITQVESKLNMYQLGYTAFSCADYNNGWSMSISPKDTLDSLVNGQKHGGLGLLTIVYKETENHSVSHAVVVYGKPGASGAYNVYDPNTSSAGGIFVSGTAGNRSARFYSGGKTYEVVKCKYENDFSIFNEFDIDNSNNTLGTDNDGESLLSSYDIVVIRATNAFRITNAEGETTVFQDGMCAGEMPVYGVNLLADGSESGMILLLVDPSGEYFCEPEGESTVLSFDVLTEERYVTGAADESAQQFAVNTVSNIADES